MTETVEIRFKVNDEFTSWEPETVRSPTLNQIPTAVVRVTALRQRYPEAAIIIERRGDKKPERPQMFRFSIYVRKGSMPVNDPQGANGVSVVDIYKQTLFSRPFTESEREAVAAAIYKQFPEAELTEVKV